MIDSTQLAELLAGIDPWQALLAALEEPDADIREAFYAEFRNGTQDYAQLSNRVGLRGLSNTCMLLLRGLDDRKVKSLDENDTAQLSIWMAGVQAYLQAELSDVSCLLTDLQSLAWIPKLAPAAVDMLNQRLLEPLGNLQALAEARVVEMAAMPAANDLTPDTFAETFAFADTLGESSAAAFDMGGDLAEPASMFAVANDDAESFAPGRFALGDVADTPRASIEAAENFGYVETADAFATADGDDTDTDGDIWIAPEEFQLVSETVQARLLPELASMASADDAQIKGVYAEVVYQIELLGNAFAVLSLERSQHMSSSLVQALPDSQSANPEQLRALTEPLMSWVLAMVDFCARPEQSSSSERVVELVSAAAWPAPLSADDAAGLAAEFARIRIGMDPRLKAARKTEITPEDINLAAAEDVMPQVLQGMLLELPDNAHSLSESIAEFVRTGDLNAIDNARRVAHTLKGDANTVGIKGIANLTHALEDIFIELAKNPDVPQREFADLLIQAADCTSAMADHVLGRGEAPSDAMEVMQLVQNVANDLVTGKTTAEIRVHADTPSGDTLAQRLAEIASTLPTAAPVPSTSAADVPMLQVPADVLDRLLDFSSEALVLLRQIETQIRAVDEGQAEIERQRHDGAALLVELDRAVNLRGVAMQSSRGRGESIDPLELDQYNELYTTTRRLMEVSADEQTSRNTIERACRRLIDLAAEQEKVQLELQNQLSKTRQVTVKEFVGRFQRTVRQTSKLLDKDVNFTVTGQDTLIDRVQMENLIDPLMHALRNSVDHGIESQSLRMTRQKPLSGDVRLGFERDGLQIVVKLTDDGAGLNYDRIKAKAVSLGFISEGDHISEDDLAQIILLPGFSTKDEVTQVSGRGIGLDVVYQRIQDLRGTLNIRSKPGSGTTTEIRLPASMASLYAALAPITNGWVAIASDSVESFDLIEPHMCHIENGQVLARIGEQDIVLNYLEALVSGLRQEAKLPAQPGVGVLVRQSSGELQLGFLPTISEMRTIIVKDFGPYMRTFPGVRGGTILGDGSVAPVIDARELMRNTTYQPWSARDETYRETLSKQVKLRALVADDSLSVRRALEQLLSDIGFEVMAARDGLEALALIKEREPDILLLDLEMPRMNGLEVSSFVRKSESMAETPIIMITSRTSEKHAKMAEDAGVTHLLSKPYSEDALIELVQKCVGFKSSVVA